jgi:hypothetical protein
MGNKIFKWIIRYFSFRDLAEGGKVIENNKAASIFEGKYESRYKIRSKLEKILSSYLSKNKLLLPLPVEKGLGRKMKKILGFFLLNFYILLLFQLFIYKFIN